MSWIRSKSPENLSPLLPHLHAISEGRIKKKKVYLVESEVALCFGLWMAWASVIASGSLPLLWVLCSEGE